MSGVADEFYALPLYRDYQNKVLFHLEKTKKLLKCILFPPADGLISSSKREASQVKSSEMPLVLLSQLVVLSVNKYHQYPKEWADFMQAGGPAGEAFPPMSGYRISHGFHSFHSSNTCSVPPTYKVLSYVLDLAMDQTHSSSMNRDGGAKEEKRW